MKPEVESRQRAAVVEGAGHKEKEVKKELKKKMSSMENDELAKLKEENKRLEEIIRKMEREINKKVESSDAAAERMPEVQGEEDVKQTRKRRTRAEIDAVNLTAAKAKAKEAKKKEKTKEQDKAAKTAQKAASKTAELLEKAKFK